LQRLLGAVRLSDHDLNTGAVVSQVRSGAVEREPVVGSAGRRLDPALPVQAGLLLSLHRSAGNRAVAGMVQRRAVRAPEPRTNLIGGEVATDERTESTRVLLGLSRDEVYGVPGLGIAPWTSVRLEHARNFFERGASEAEARFVFRARMAEADLDRLVGVMVEHPGQLAAVEWALARAGIAQLAEAMANARGLGYDTALTGAYYDAGVLPVTSIADVLHVIALGVPRTNSALVGVVARFLAAGAGDDDARFALGTGLIDADFNQLLAVMLAHRGQRAAVQWALTRTGIAGLETCMINAQGLRYDTALTGAYYDAGVLPATSIADVLHVVDLGAPVTNPTRVSHVLAFLAGGAGDAEARFALGAATNDADLVQLHGVMRGHLGQLAAVRWAVGRAGTDWVRVAADLKDARDLGYDTELAEWARKSGEAQAEVVLQEQAARIKQDLRQQKTALRPALTEAEEELGKLKTAWTKKHWTYHPATPSDGDSPGTPAKGTAKHNPPGKAKVQERTEAETKVSVAAAAIDKAKEDAKIRLAQAEAGKADTAQAVVDDLASYVRAGVASTDAKALYAQLGHPGFRALYDTFGTGTGALVTTLGVPLVVDYLKARPPAKLAPFVAHFTAGGIVTLHQGIDVDDALDMWDVFGVQFAPLIAFTRPIRLRSLLFDNRAPLAQLFKLSGGAATTLLTAIGEGPFEWLLRELKPADIAEFLTRGVPAPRLAQIGDPARVKKFALGCAADRTSLITLCNAAAVATPQIVTLIDLCTVGSLTLARCVTALGLARDPTALVAILQLQTRAGLSDTNVDAMLTAHALLPAPARGIEHSVYRRLAERAQNEVYLDGPGLQLLLSPANTHYPATITWIEDKKTGYDTGSGYSEMYDVNITNPANGTVTVCWQVHLHRKGGHTDSGSIKKYSQRYNTGPGVYRKTLPMELENMVRATR
jgi:hypothetical protein